MNHQGPFKNEQSEHYEMLLFSNISGGGRVSSTDGTQARTSDGRDWSRVDPHSKSRRWGSRSGKSVSREGGSVSPRWK